MPRLYLLKSKCVQTPIDRRVNDLKHNNLAPLLPAPHILKIHPAGLFPAQSSRVYDASATILPFPPAPALFSSIWLSHDRNSRYRPSAHTAPCGPWTQWSTPARPFPVQPRNKAGDLGQNSPGQALHLLCAAPGWNHRALKSSPLHPRRSRLQVPKITRAGYACNYRQRDGRISYRQRSSEAAHQSKKIQRPLYLNGRKRNRKPEKRSPLQKKRLPINDALQLSPGRGDAAPTETDRKKCPPPTETARKSSTEKSIQSNFAGKAEKNRTAWPARSATTAKHPRRRLLSILGWRARGRKTRSSAPLCSRIPTILPN